MADVKWIKIVTDIFENEKIVLIENMPDADSLIVVWFKILCLAGRQNKGGVLQISKKMAYTDEMLATIFRTELDTIKIALEVFLSFGMIGKSGDCYIIKNWEKYQNVDGLKKIREQTKQRTAKYRDKKRLASDNSDGDVTVTQCDATDKNREDKNREDKNRTNNIISDKPKKIVLGSYSNVFFDEIEFEKLKAEFTDYEEQIENLSEYMESTGRKYKNHLATIRSWAKNNYLHKSNTKNALDAKEVNPYAKYSHLI